MPKSERELQAQISRTEWGVIPATSAWIALPEAGLVMERRAGAVSEQRIALSNTTVLQGDNFVFLRLVPSRSPGVIQLERALEQASGLPHPFSRNDLSVMRGRVDEAGALSWTEWTDGAGTTCVLALRRLTVATRLLPRQAGAVDMVMRNCVRGGAEKALAPAAPDIVAYPARARVPGQRTQRNLTPLAAPLP
jgi:hypothetical protein